MTKQASGERISKAERDAVVGSLYGERVANELNPENIRSGNYSSGGAQNIGTERINAEEYTQILKDAKMLPEEDAEDISETADNPSVTASHDSSLYTREPVAAEINKTAPVGADESTSVNTDPAQHTAAEQAIIDEYQNSVDDNLVNYIETVQNNPGAKLGRYSLKPVSDRAAEDIKQATGVDVSGYKVAIEPRTVAHILNGHGENGSADNSMRDINDIARMQYVIDNYDAVTAGGTSSAYVSVKANGKHTQAQTVVFEKAVNGTYYVVEAVPETSKRTAFIVSAYMQKKTAASPSVRAEALRVTPESAAVKTAVGNVQTAHAEALRVTSETKNAQSPVNEASASTNSIQQKSENIKGLKEPENDSDADTAYKQAYNMGKAGVSLERAKASVPTLTEAQIEAAYNAGAVASERSAGERAAANTKAANGKTGRKKGTVKGEGVNIADLTAAFNDTQRKAYRILSTIAEATGIDIVLYKSELNAEGKFDSPQGKFTWKDNTIYIDINAGLTGARDVGHLASYTMLRTFSHEFTHFIEKWNPAEYNNFRKLVFQQLEQQGENVHDLIENEIKKSDSKLSYDAASREVVAQAMTDILPDVNFVQELCEKHRTVFDKLLEKLKEFVREIKDYYASISNNGPKEARALKKEINGAVHYLEDIVKMFDNVAVQAVENYQATETVEEEIDSKTAEIESETGKNTTKTDDAFNNEPIEAMKENGFLHDRVQEEIPEEVQYQSRASLSNEAEMFRRDIDNWNRNDKPDGETFILGSTGNVLQGLGAIESDVYLLSDKINTIFKDHPEMTVKEIKNIPEILENPVLVLASRNAWKARENTRLIVFGMVKAQNGLPIMVAFDLRPIENKLYLSDMQKVASAYTKDNSPTATMNLIKNSDVLYADKEKTTSLLHSVGFQHAYSVEQSGYMGNISYVDKTVNVSGKKFSDVFTEDTEQHQQRDSLTDREVLTMAASEIGVDDLTDGEKDALRIFKKRLDKWEQLQTERTELGRLYKEQQFGYNVDRSALSKI